MREIERFPNANPFRVPPQVVESSRKRAFYAAIKVCLVAACALSLTLVLATQSRRWLLYQLTSDYESLPSEARSLRLVEIAGLDELGIPFLVEQLTSDDRVVARQAYDLLSDNQSRWSMLSQPNCQSRHTILVDSLEAIVDRIEVARMGWVTSMLQQTIVEHVQHDDESSRSLHLAATDLLARLTISDQPQERIASFNSSELDASAADASVVRAEPLVVDSAGETDAWINWPPEQEYTDSTSAAPTADDLDESESPSIYRSSAGDAADLTLIPADPATVELKTFEPSAVETPTIVETAAHEMEAPLQTYNIRSVIHWLASTDQEQKRQAELELIRRGLDSNQIAIAKSLSIGSVENRLETIDRIAHDATIDPRPWLLWLLDDEHREVKLRAINILATIPDEGIKEMLRERMSAESDPSVAARIRRVLELR
jgi:hypothetical protein